MGSNGIVTEKAHLNVDLDVYKENHERIFGKKKERIKEPITNVCNICFKLEDDIGESGLCDECTELW